MIFLTALALVIPIILVFFIIVYLHTVIIYNILIFIIDKFTFSKDPFLYKWKYKEKNVLRISFLFFMLFHLLLFGDFYRTYINDKTKHHDAKVYYVVGMIPQTYSILFGRFNTPLYPVFLGFTKPADRIKDYLFKKGSSLIPDTDAEKELWEYEWFYYPYMIRMSTMYDTYHRSYGRLTPEVDITKETHNYMYSRVERLYEIISILNEKKIADSYRDADVLKKLPLMVLYYNEKSQWLIGNILKYKSEFKLYIKKEEFIKRKIQLKQWLQSIPDKLDTQMQYQEWGNAHLKDLLKIEATRQQVILFLMQDELFEEIIKNEFSCKNETIKDYINLRNRYMMNGKNSILDRLSNHGGKKDARDMYNISTRNLSSEFFRLILEKYCSEYVLGKDEYTSSFKEKGLLSLDGTFSSSIKKLNKGKINE